MDVRAEREIQSVLVVDDDPRVHRAAKSTLGAQWFVFRAETIEQARAVVGDRHPTYVIVDLRLGNENGLDLLEELKHRQPLLPTALLSGDLTSELAVRACAAAVAVIAEKPSSFRTILAMLSSLRPDDLKKPSRWLGSSARTEMPAVVHSATTVAEAKRDVERSLIERALIRNNGNVSATAREIEMPRSLLNLRIAEYGLRRDKG